MHVVDIPPSNQGGQSLYWNSFEVYGRGETFDVGEMVTVSGMVVQHLISLYYSYDPVQSLIRLCPSTPCVVFPERLQGGSSWHFYERQRTKHKNAEIPSRKSKKLNEANRKPEEVRPRLHCGWLGLPKTPSLQSTFVEDTEKAEIASSILRAISGAGQSRSCCVQTGPSAHCTHPPDRLCISAQTSQRWGRTIYPTTGWIHEEHAAYSRIVC